MGTNSNNNENSQSSFVSRGSPSIEKIKDRQKTLSHYNTYYQERNSYLQKRKDVYGSMLLNSFNINGSKD